MQIKRTVMAALVVAAVSAPTATAKVAVEPTGTGVKQQSVEVAPASSSSYAEMAARREAIANRQWAQAENAPVRPLVAADPDSGFNWPSAVIGATVPLALLVVGLLGRPLMQRRRSRVGLA